MIFPDIFRRFAPVLACLSLAACSTLRDAFLDRAPLTPPDQARLGHTPKDEILRQFGEPDETNARRLDATPLEVLFYYGDDDGYGFLACEFARGALNAYSFHGIETSPPQGFGAAERARLVKGKTTRHEVAQALGVPQAKALLPTTIGLPALDSTLGGAPLPLARPPEGAREVWQYHTRNFDETPRKTSQQTLSVFFDGQGVYLGDSLLQELSTQAP